MKPTERLIRIFEEIGNHDLSDEERENYIQKIVRCASRETVCNGLLDILASDSTELWNIVIEYMYYLQSVGYGFQESRTVALLYRCVEKSDTVDGNLVWTITRTLKSLSYDADYDPYDGPDVYREMQLIEKRRPPLNISRQ